MKSKITMMVAAAAAFTAFGSFAKDDAEAETGRLVEQLNSAKLSLNTGSDRLVARAGKGGVSNAELIKTTAKLKELAKTMG